MKIEDVRKLAEERNIPKHLIDKVLPKIELDENGNVIDKITVYEWLATSSYNVEIVRANLESLQHLKEKMKRKRAGK